MLQEVNNKIAEARKNKNKKELLTYQLIKSELITNEHSLSEIDVLRKMIKERDRAETLYLENGRRDLAKKEYDEKIIIRALLPKEPSTETIYNTIKHIISILPYVVSMLDAPLIIGIVLTKYPTAQKSTIIKIFKSLL